MFLFFGHAPSGNSDTASTGADFASHRRESVWLIDSTATAVRTNSDDKTTAERYLGMLRDWAAALRPH